jgi:hypothetical protein
MNTKKVLVLCLVGSGIGFAKSSLFTIKTGDPSILLQVGKTATFEIDYSNMIVTDGKHHENDMLFYDWMITQDEDKGKWLEDWEKKDSAECVKEFREKFNDEVKKGIKLTKLGKDYHVIMRLSRIDFGPGAKYGFGGVKGGEADADGELEIQDKNTKEVLLILSFEKLEGESSFKQIGRLKGIFENFGEKISDYLKDYQKQQKKSKR